MKKKTPLPGMTIEQYIVHMRVQKIRAEARSKARHAKWVADHPDRVRLYRERAKRKARMKR